jgi:hypothetical protein
MSERGEPGHGRGVFYTDNKGNIGFYTWEAAGAGLTALFLAIGSLG